MNPIFITASQEVTRYRRLDIINKPINISLCKSIYKGKYKVYPDNEGIPSIVFKGIDEEWVYNRVEDRDADFERITTNQWIKDFFNKE